MKRWKIARTGDLDEKCLSFSTVWGVMSVGLLFSFGLNFITFICIVIFCGLFYAFVMNFCGIVPVKEDKGNAFAVSSVSGELVKKSRDRLDELETIMMKMDYPTFGPMLGVLSRLVEKQERIHDVLQKHPERAQLVQHFIMYYLTQTVEFVKIYWRIEQLHSSSTSDAVRAAEIIRKLKLFSSAYDEALKKVTEEDFTNLAVELSVADSMLSSDGFHASSRTADSNDVSSKEGEFMSEENIPSADDLQTNCFDRTQTLLDFVISYNDDDLPLIFSSLVKKQRCINIAIMKDKPLAFKIRRHLEHYLPKTIQLVSAYTNIRLKSAKSDLDAECLAKIDTVLSGFDIEYDSALQTVSSDSKTALDDVILEAKDMLATDGFRETAETAKVEDA